MSTLYGGWPYNLAQLGKESTPGVAVAATTIMRGIFGGFDDQRKSETIDENIGRLFPTDRTRITSEGVSVSMPATPVTYEQLPHILEASIGKASPSGAGPYVRDYAFPTGSAVNDIGTYTMEVGNRNVPDDLKKIPFCWVEQFELSGEAGGLWTMSATWQGQRDLTLGAFSAATLPAVSEAVFGNTIFYVDDSGGSIGSTAYPGILLSATITVKSGIMWVPIGDGNLYPTALKHAAPEVTFSFEYELEDGGAGTSFVAQERGKYKSEAIRLFQLNIPGPGNDDLTISLAGKYDKPNPYANKDGNTSVSFDGHAVLSDVDALSFAVSVTNDVAAL